MLIFPRFWILKIGWLIKRAEHAAVNCEFPALHIAKVNLLLELGLLLNTNLLIFLWIIKPWPQCLFINEVSALCFREEYASRLIEWVYGIVLFIVLVPFWGRPTRRSLLGEGST
jgi:hypothetical protein